MSWTQYFKMIGKVVLIGGLLLSMMYCIEHVKTESIKLQEEARATERSEAGFSSPIFLDPFEGPIKSPLKLSGSAPGSWFERGTLGVYILEIQEGGEVDVLGTLTAHAEPDWVEKDEVKFSGTEVFKKPHGCRGKLLFQKINPDGHPVPVVEAHFGFSFCENEP